MNTMVERFGWLLLHSLWQGALVWFGLQVALVALKRSRPQTRYLVACAALGVAACAPLFTLVRLQQAVSRPDSSAAAPMLPAVAPIGEASDVTPSVPVRWALKLSPPNPTVAWSIVVGLWAMGVAWTAVRVVRQWRSTQQIVRAPRERLPEAVRRQFDELARRMGVKRAVEIGESIWVEVPSVVRWLKPVILVPAGAFAGLTPIQIEALLAHELAHVVRQDFAVNFVQTVLEIVFFYHPAILAISDGIRRERENACDDIAVRLTGDPIAYVAALVHFEGMRSPQFGLGASGNGRLLARVERLIGHPKRRVRVTLAWGPTVLAGVVVYLSALFVFPDALTKMNAAEPAVRDMSVSPVERVPLYRIRVGDKVRIEVDGIEQLGKAVRCDANGEVNPPLLNSLHIGGLTLAEASERISGEYRKWAANNAVNGLSNRVKDARARLVVEEYAPRPVYISGQVAHAGRFDLPVEAIATPIGIIFQAGGLTPIADGKHVRVTRPLSDGTLKVFTANVDAVIRGETQDKAIVESAMLALEPGDIVYVPERGIADGAQTSPLPHPPTQSGTNVSQERAITLIALETVRVAVKRKLPDDREGEDIFVGTLARGQRQVVPWSAPIFIQANAGENLQIEFNGKQYPLQFTGPGRSMMN